MPFNATVNLGTVGSDITGQTVSISGCTGASCGSGCTSLATSQSVSSFPKIITGIPDNVVSLFVRVDGGPCVGTTQCISVTQGGATPTPTPTINASPTPTPTINASPTPTINASPTPTPTINASPTPTVTPRFPGCSSTVTGEYNGSDLYNYPDRQLDFTGTPNGSIISFVCTANDRPNNISIRTDLGVVETTGWFGNSSGYDPSDYWYPTQSSPVTITITYDNTKTYYIDVLTAPMLPAPNDINDNWEVSIQCLGVPTPTPTQTPTVTPIIYNEFYIASPVEKSVTGTTYCDSPGYVMSAVVLSTSTTISEMLGTLIYDSNGEPFIGAGSSYAYAISTVQGQNTNDIGTWNFIEIDSMAMVTNVGSQSCTGGGGPL